MKICNWGIRRKRKGWRRIGTTGFVLADASTHGIGNGSETVIPVLLLLVAGRSVEGKGLVLKDLEVQKKTSERRE